MKLVWFRNDLRVTDNHALYAACQSSTCEVMAVAVISPEQWKLQDEAKCRVQFWLENLRYLQRDLQALNIPLKLINVATNQELPQKFIDLVKQYEVTELFFNKEYPEYETQRDHNVVEVLRQLDVKSNVFDSDLVFAPGSVTNQQGDMYRVFTPFSKAWRAKFYREPQTPLPAPTQCVASEKAGLSDSIPNSINYALTLGADYNPELWPAGSEAAHLRLRSFVENKYVPYKEERDFPAKPATSSLSAYLTVGAISVRQCIAAAELYSDSSAQAHSFENQWITELIWREFYRHLLVAYPDMNRLAPFKPDIEAKAQWLPADERFQAWCAGETGFAIVDAGMKQLKETGWMHNRVRMITASFLTKLLRQDWRLGAQFFMQHLIDGDFSSNLGGWQWSASVGADAAPYFRIFNPMRQAERFDKSGAYISQWLPQLANLNSIQQHDSVYTKGRGYHAPIIDYAKAREESLAAYKEA